MTATIVGRPERMVTADVPSRWAWVAGWRAVLRVALRDLRRRKGRTLLVASMVALPVAGSVIATTIQRGDAQGEHLWWGDAVAQVWLPAVVDVPAGVPSLTYDEVQRWQLIDDRWQWMQVVNAPVEADLGP
jgi:hypothetical protein